MMKFGIWLLAAFGLAVGAAIATTLERNDDLAEVCAARDLRALALLEQHIEAEDARPEVLSDALFAIVQARTVCEQGHVAEALVLYDRITFGEMQSAKRR